MEICFQIFLFLTVSIPLFTVFINTFFQKSFNDKGYKISLYASFLTLLVSAGVLALFFTNHSKEIFGQTLFVLHPTPVGVVLALFVASVSVVIHSFSVKYMYDDPGYLRYFILLDLMIGDIFLLLFCGNILIFAATWHLMGVLLYFLLVHNFQKEQTIRYSFYTFFTHLLADIPLMLAFWLIYHFYHTTEIDHFLSIAYVQEIDAKFMGVTPLIALLLIISAMIKSTQFPFHLWLPFTLEGPTPVSALMHAGIVNAGAFLANRFAPVFVHGDIALHLAFAVGLATAVIGSTQMLIQQDIKKALAYSTMGQMGYMMLEIGAGAFALAVYHMMVHGMFKASLFLGSGGAIHEARLKPNITNASLFDFFFRIPKGKPPSWMEYLFFVLFIPAAITWILFEPLIAEHGFWAVMAFYFFAWVTSAQVVYTIYHQAPLHRIRAVLLATIGYTLALWFYIYAEKSINMTLYFDTDLIRQLIHTAVWPDFFAHSAFILALLALFAGALLLYRKLLHKESIFIYFGELHDFFYRIFSREFYIQDICHLWAAKIVGFSRYLNEKLKG